MSIETTKGDPPTLARNDIRIVQGVKEIPVQYFQRQPSTVGILVDTSGSMAPKLDATVAGITDFVHALDLQDEIFLLAFSLHPFLLQPPTSDHALVLSRLALLHAYGRTALYDALIDGIYLAGNGCNPGNALLVITDGMDDASIHSRKQFDSLASEHIAPIYPIGIGDSVAPMSSSILYAMALSKKKDPVDATRLKELATRTDGKSYIVSPADDGTTMRVDTTAIAHQIDNRYFVGFVAADLMHEPVRIELRNHKNASLKIENAPAGVES